MTTLMNNVEMKEGRFIIVYGKRYIVKDLYLGDNGIYYLWKRDIEDWNKYDYLVTLNNRVIACTSLEILDFVDYYENLENY